jgi:hypothetical protein
MRARSSTAAAGIAPATHSPPGSTLDLSREYYI